MSRKIAQRAKILKVSNIITGKLVPRFIIFADALVRYSNTRLRGNFNSLRFIIGAYIILREGTIAPNQLAQLMLRSNYSMTRLIDDMVEEGLVVRVRSKKDRRRIDIKLTESGLREMTKYVKDIEEIEQEIDSCLREEDVSLLSNLIRIMIPTTIENAGKHPDAWQYYYRGFAYRSIGKHVEALKDFESCILHTNNKSLISMANREIDQIKR